MYSRDSKSFARSLPVLTLLSDACSPSSQHKDLPKDFSKSFDKLGSVTDHTAFFKDKTMLQIFATIW